jgi:uncharacterized membrane protein YhaH (DUF805 family)
MGSTGIFRPNRISLRLAFRPLAHAFDFRCRSTRKEVVSFWLFYALCHLGVVKFEGLSPQFAAVAGIMWTIFWGWPWFPLLVRRLHDQGRSGYWAMVPLAGIPLFPLNLWLAPAGNGVTFQFSLGWIDLYRSLAWSPLTIASSVTMVALSIVTSLFYLLPSTKGPNRYGPDPRLNVELPLVLAET